MLAVPDPLVVLYMLHDGTQGYLLHDFPQHCSQIDKPVVPQILILILLEEVCPLV